MSDQERSNRPGGSARTGSAADASLDAPDLDGAFETVFDGVDDAVFVFDVEDEGEGEGVVFRFRRNNPAHASCTGVRVGEHRGRTPREILGDGDGEAIADEFRACVRRRETIEYDRPLEYPAGTVEWHATLTPIVEDGAVTRIVGIARERTNCGERDRERRRYEAFVEHSRDAITVLSPDGNVEYVSPASEHVLGCREGLVGANVLEYVASDHEERVRDALERVREDGPGSSATVEYRFRCTARDARARWVESSLTNALDDPAVDGILVTTRDVTDRKASERELERQNDLFERAQEIANIGAWETDLRTDEGWWTSEVGRIYGLGPDYDPAPLEGIEYVHPDDRPALRSAVDRAIADGEPYDLELRITDERGSRRWVRARGDPQLEDGEVVRIRGTIQDVTERKECERALERNRERLQVLFDQAPDGIIVHDATGAVLDVNETLVESLGYDRAELRSMTVTDFEIGLDLAEARDLWAGMDVGETARIEGKHERADGSTFPVEVWINRIEIEGEPRYLALSRDVTERKEYERRLERARTELRQVIDLVPDLIFAKNRDGEYVLANETTANYYGLDPAEVEGRTDRDLLPSEEQATQFRAADLTVIESDEPKRAVEEELLTADGDTRILQTTKIPYELAGTGEDAVLGYARDVTELKEYEQRLETQRDNLEVLNQIVRHDIRNELQLVLAHAERLRECVDEDDRECVDHVLSSARQAIEITESARDVAEAVLRTDADREPIELSAVLGDVIDAVRSTHDDAVVALEEPIPDVAVVADDMLDAVFRNLLTNAIEHNDKRTPEVTVGATVDGDRVAVSVADNGPGIPADCEERLFEKGETALNSDGTGLGLYLVRTLGDRYGGDVRIADGDAEGATFVVELPADD